MPHRLESLRVGDLVYWEDPDSALCSAEQRITFICTDSGRISNEEDVVILNDGTEAFAAELRLR